jgi:Flp pilus assembly pilin Flp
MLSVLIMWIKVHLPRSERGQDLIEYALLGGLIAAAIVAVITAELMTGALENMVSGIADCIDFDAGTDCGAP